MPQPATLIQLLGAGCFGAIIGWHVYYLNRHRRDAVQLTDLVTLVGILGGAGILKVFPEASDLFGAYGIGLFVGFFGYLLMLVRLVSVSRNFDFDWFLDGRSKRPEGPYEIPAGVAQPVRPPMERGGSPSSGS